MNKYDRRGGLVWPLFLIAAGALFLLNNLNLIDFSLWQVLFHLWPAILIAIGLDLLIPRRTLLGSLLALLAILAVLAGSFWLFQFGDVQPDRSVEINVPLADAERAEITLEPAVAELTIDAGTRESMLLSGQVSTEYPDDFERKAELDGQVLRYRLATLSEDQWHWIFPASTPEWELRLSDQLPLDLSINAGVGAWNLALEKLDLRSVFVDFGVGRAVVMLPEGGEYTAVIDGGIGEVVVSVPADASVSISLERGLTTLQLPSGYQQEGSLILSPAAQTGESTIKLEVDLGIGIIQIVERP